MPKTTNTFFPSSVLLTRLRHVAEGKKPATFLVGSPIADPIPRVSGILALVRARLKDQCDDDVFSDAPGDYQAAFNHLNAVFGKDACNEIIRDAVLSAYGGNNPQRKDARLGLPAACSALERDINAWNIGPAVEALGKIITKVPLFQEYVLTTNFDGLLEIAIQRAGGSILRTALHGDGNIRQTVGQGCHVVHLHGYWYGTDTLHAPSELMRRRVALVDSFKALLRNRLLIVVGYGGWDDMVTTALRETLQDDSVEAEVIWCFLETDGETISRKYQRLMEFLQPGAGRGRVTYFSGVDAAQLFPALWAVINQSPPDRTKEKYTETPPTLTTTTATPRWITINYRGLLDPDETTRTGEKLTDALSVPGLAATIQQFLDPYSSLLSAALEMTGLTERAQSTLMDLFPMETPEPAWVALLRSGRIHMTTDGKAHVHVFLRGTEAAGAYRQNYSVIRHCLAALLEIEGASLHIDVFAYENDYAKSELRLNCQSFPIAKESFERDEDKIGIGLKQLADFLSNGAEIQGGTLREGEQPRLAGKLGATPTLAGNRVELSDLAVAYRAVFHAGANAAFVSLDPCRDPTKVKVNFGGLLEDTRLGSVLLEADKRFKTISAGLDPTTFNDRRDYTRTHVPGFLSSHERYFLDDPSGNRGWVQTRFWYYPDSVRLKADDNYETVTIVSARFTADAERSREDFASREEYDKHSKDSLLPNIRTNIKDLNQRYAQYAAAYSELAELDTVARLLAICQWFALRKPTWIDLDELLSVELPAVNTERTRTKLITTTYLTMPDDAEMTSEFITRHTTVVNLTPVLEQTVSDYFGSAEELAACFLLTGPSLWKKIVGERAPSPAELFIAYRDRNVRELVGNKEDLQNLVSFAARKITSSVTMQVSQYEATVAATAQAIEEIEARIEWAKSRIETLISEICAFRRTDVSPEDRSRRDSEIHEILVLERDKQTGEYNRLVEEHKSQVAREIWLTDQYNNLRQGRSKIFNRLYNGYHGGVSADPQRFTFEVCTTDEEIVRFKEIQQRARPNYTKMENGELWVNTSSTEGLYEGNKSYISRLRESAQGITRERTPGPNEGSWEFRVLRDGRQLEKRAYDAGNEQLEIRRLSWDGAVRAILGRIEARDRIVFSCIS